LSHKPAILIMYKTCSFLGKETTVVVPKFRTCSSSAGSKSLGCGHCIGSLLCRIKTTGTVSVVSLVFLYFFLLNPTGDQEKPSIAYCYYKK